jgi:hypothetical protein
VAHMDVQVGERMQQACTHQPCCEVHVTAPGGGTVAHMDVQVGERMQHACTHQPCCELQAARGSSLDRLRLIAPVSLTTTVWVLVGPTNPLCVS